MSKRIYAIQVYIVLFMFYEIFASTLTTRTTNEKEFYNF